MKKSDKFTVLVTLALVWLLLFLAWQEPSFQGALGFHFIAILLVAMELLEMAPRQIKRKVFCALVKIGAITEPTGNYHIKSC